MNDRMGWDHKGRKHFGQLWQLLRVEVSCCEAVGRSVFASMICFQEDSQSE